MYNEEYLAEYAVLKQYSWDEFVSSIMNKNRFHTNYLDMNLLEEYLYYSQKKIKKDTYLYRCRLSNGGKYTLDEMGAPEISKTRDGRANAKGIRCLYLANSAITAICETRTGVYEYVTVGKFRLKEDINVVDLRVINQISPFTEDLNCLQFAINKETLNRINDEMCKIMRSSDSEIDYVPTQYITDFVKSIVNKEGKPQYMGVEYKSVMHPSGYNVAIFEPDIFECVSVDEKYVDKIKYTFKDTDR